MIEGGVEVPREHPRQFAWRRQHRELRAPLRGAAAPWFGVTGCTQTSSTVSPFGSSSSAVGCAMYTGATDGPSLSGNRE